MNWFRKKKLQRHKIEDVKAGETITIQWNSSESGYVCPLCINNDPKEKKIFLEITWSARWVNNQKVNCNEKEKVILDYNHYALRNFNLLNPLPKENKKEISVKGLRKQKLKRILKKWF
jgi:hypothetical protein